MVLLAPLVGAAVFLSGFAAALPTNYGSSSNDYGSSDSSSSDSSSSDSSSSDPSSSSYGDSSYGSSGNYGSSDSSSYGSSGYDGSNYGSSGYDSSNYGGDSSDYNSGDDSSVIETIDSTATFTAYDSYQTQNYGSGSSYWGGSGYADCVNQCIAQYGGGMGGSYQPSEPTAVGGYDGSGSGATHTVIVAPSQGDLRFVPFYTNASVGDVIEFLWDAGPHTVTKSSQLTPCNKSSEDPVFASGMQNASFVFREVVNDTDPIFYYCGVPGHCQKGMFGVINAQTTVPGAPSSLGAMMSSIAANDSSISAYAAYVNNVTSDNAAAASWGSTLDMSGWPAWAMSEVMTNVLYNQAFMAMNPSIVAGGAMDLSGAGNNTLALPMDFSLFNAASPAPAAASVSAAPTPVGADATSAAASSPASAASSASSSSPSTNGASSAASPRFLVAAVVVVATIFAL